MPEFKTLERDTRELRLAVGVLLLDGFTDAPELSGEITVSLANDPDSKPFQKIPGGSFFFFDLAPGNYNVLVRSNPKRDRPYYLPVDIPVTVPMPHKAWPVFPDAGLADSTLPLNHPDQFAPYRNQRATATLRPTTRYPFPAGATLVRGTVYANGAELSAATVTGTLNFQSNPPRSEVRDYTTAADGGFVLFFKQMGGTAGAIALRVTHANHPTQNVSINVHRGITVATDIIMAP